MARARNIKPGFFKNYDLADQGPLVQLLFAGLWCLADKEGRLKDQPRFIKAEIFPYYDCDVNGELTKLARLGFVNRYTAAGVAVIELVNFKKHQSPHHTEKDSVLPPWDGVSGCNQTAPVNNGVTTVNPPKHNGGNPPDSLIPDSGFTDSLKPDSPKPDSKPLQPAKPVAPTNAVWVAYSTAYFNRYGAEPLRNKKVNGMLAQFIERLPAAVAPDVTAFYLTSNRGLYVSAKHPIDLLLRDAEALHTEWVTGRAGTESEARQADRTQANGNVFGKLIAEAAHGD